MSRQATADVFLPRERASASVAGAGVDKQRSRGLQARVEPALGVPPECSPEDGKGGSLAEQQQLFLAAITTPEADPGQEALTAAARLLTPSATLSPAQRLEIYRSGYHARLIECLTDDYPTLQHALGEAEFERVCRDYITCYPSRGPSLNVFGQHMAQHMTEHCRVLPRPEARFLAELAELEWTIVAAIHAPGGSILKPEDLVTVAPDAWPDAKLIVNPSLRVLRTEHPVNAYFQALRAGRPVPIPPPKASVVGVYRTGRSVWRLPLDVGMADLLQLLAKGEPLGAAMDSCAQRLGSDDEGAAAAKVTRWFSSAVSSGLFSGVTLPGAA